MDGILPEKKTDYIEAIGPTLAKRVKEKFSALHKKGDTELALPMLKRAPIGGQADAIRAGVRALDSGMPAIVYSAQMGVGKTLIALAVAHVAHRGRPYRCVIMCPPHLPEKWVREILATIPGCTARIYEHTGELLALARTRRKPTRPEFMVISESRCKLGPGWMPAVYHDKLDDLRCPNCHEIPVNVRGGVATEPIYEDKLARKKHKCANCEQPLWQWTSKPNRWPLASYIKTHMRGMIDYAIIDEAHTAAAESSAIAISMSELVAAADRSILLTGTLLNGYAHSIFHLLFRAAPRTLREAGFDFSEVTGFAEKYGRIERTSTTESKADHRQSRGGTAKTRMKVIPGIMPSVFGHHLLDKTIFLSLEDVADRLPPLEEWVEGIDMDEEQAAAYGQIETDLLEATAQAVARGDMRMLSVMMHTLLCYADHPYDYGEIGYTDPETGQWIHVTTAPDLDKATLRPKEVRLLEIVRERRERGRQCWVYVQMTGKRDIQPRLVKLLEKEGARVKILRSQSVPTKERERWIAKNGAGSDVIISHPQLVETGLDLFVKGGGHNFSSLIFYQPSMMTSTTRQASRRSWRIGQPLDCEVGHMFYRGTLQHRMVNLMAAKLQAAEAIDGKFSSEGLAAMAEGGEAMGLALAKSLLGKLTLAKADTRRRIQSAPLVLPQEHYSVETRENSLMF